MRRTFEVRCTFFDLSLKGVIDTELDVRDTYINLRVAADRLRLPDGTPLAVADLEAASAQ